MNLTNQENLEGRWPIIKHRYWIKDCAISHEACDLIIKEAGLESSFEGGFMEKGETWHNPAMRKTQIVFNNPMSLPGMIMESYINCANKAYWNYDIEYIEPIQIGKYTTGSHYDWHVDSYEPNENNRQRKLSAVLLLSQPTDYAGGMFEIKDIKTPLPKLSKGSIIVFPSVLLHRVTEVTHGTRYTAVAWAIGPAFR